MSSPKRYAIRGSFRGSRISEEVLAYEENSAKMQVAIRLVGKGVISNLDVGKFYKSRKIRVRQIG